MTHAKPGDKILFIDDDEDLVYALSRMLENEGFNVRHAGDGDIGVRMAAEDSPDLIILDFMMPTKSGFETCRDLRRIEPLRNVPILALTAFGRNIGEIHGLETSAGPATVQEYLEKPVSPNVLLERVATMLDGRPPAD